MKKVYLGFIVLGFLFSSSGYADDLTLKDSFKPTETKSEDVRRHEQNLSLARWTACQKTSECGVAEIGCYYWQPVNKKFARVMQRDWFQNHGCLSSVSAGPIPNVACVDRVCKEVPGKGSSENAYPVGSSGGVFDVQIVTQDTAQNRIVDGD